MEDNKLNILLEILKNELANEPSSTDLINKISKINSFLSSEKEKLANLPPELEKVLEDYDVEISQYRKLEKLFKQYLKL